MKLRAAILLFISAACAVRATSQTSPSSNWEVGAGYNYVHTNAPPTGCGCFSMNGGSASVVRQVTMAFGIAGEFNGVTNGSINTTGRSLTLLTYLAGPRYRYIPTRGHFVPFAQILVGGAHASGGLYATSGSSSGSTNAFATSMGGGVDVALTRHFAVRLVQAEYLLTLLPNGINSRQNNFSLSAGIVLRIGGR